MTKRLPLVAIGLLLVGWPAIVQSQEQVGSSSESALLARGWAALANGDPGAAADAASRVLAEHPSSSAALSLAVDANLTRGGAAAALDTYERWLGSRHIEDAYALRRVARGLLQETAAQPPGQMGRLEALQALAADGDRDAAAALQQAAASGSAGGIRALARAGDERAVRTLAAQLRTTPGTKAPIITVLGESGSKAAVQPLVDALADANDGDRAAAAEALGRLGAEEAAPALRRLLEDRFPLVRLKAAGALLRLNDTSGLSLLLDAAQSEHPMVRVAGAKELAAQPDANWQALVDSLAREADPLVRLEAAKLMTVYDEARARALLDELARSGNAGIREAASEQLASQIGTDIPTLRGLLRHGDAAIRVKAAARILALTR